MKAASATQIVTVTNSGASALNLTAIALGGVNASSFSQSNNCPASIANASSCVITVGFMPLATGALSATLSLTGNAAQSPQSVVLTGTGILTPAAAGAYTATHTATAANPAASYSIALSGGGR